MPQPLKVLIAEDSARVVPEAAGQPSRIADVSVDITELNRAEEVLCQVDESERRRPKHNAKKELFAVLGLGVFVFGLAFAFNLFEGPIELLIKYKSSPVDDFVGTLSVFSPLFMLFAYRRWQDTEAVILERQRARQEMRLVSMDAIRHRQQRGKQELAVLIGCVGLVGGVTAWLDLFEQPFQWIWDQRNTPIDESIGTLLVVGLVMIPASFTFAYRRWHETEAEVDEHQRSAMALRLLHDALDKQVRQRTAELAHVNETLRAEITERKRAEEALATERTLLRTLIDNIPDPIYAKDRSGRFLLANEAVARVMGAQRPADLLGKTDGDFYPGKFAAEYQADEERVFAGQAIINKEEPVPAATGRPRVVLTSKLPLRDFEGKIIGLAGIGRDVTEQRKIEEQYRQAQKMEAVGTLAGGIAHDFNNILAAIGGYTELAKMETAANPEVTEYLDAVQHGTKRAVDLVRQILTFSRRQELERRLVQLRPVVGEAINLLRASIPATVEFETSLATDLPCVLADASQVHQVVMNLCTNAAHAMKERPGRLTVKLENFLVDAALAETKPGLRAGPYVRLSVSDTGHGMDDATIARIFEPFFTTKAPGEGTGLGLSVVDGIMQTHEGAMTVYSHPGEGTVFHLFFPAHAGETPVEATEPATVARGQGERILYVDDEMPLARLGQKILERLGYVVEVHTKPAEALAAVCAKPDAYDLIVTDQMMPGLTGTDLAQRIHAVRPGLPVILVTGYTATLTAERIEAMGIRKLLLKPVSVEALGAVVHHVLSENPMR